MDDLSQISLSEISASKDPTWEQAKLTVSKYLVLPGALTSLIRKGWAERVSLEDFSKQVSMSGLSPECLIAAAEVPIDPDHSARETLEIAVQTLGVRFSSIVLATQASIVSMLRAKPRTGWKTHCEKTIADIEVGYKLGIKVGDLGVESGMLLGLAYRLGLGIMLSIDADRFQKYRSLEGVTGKVDPKVAIKFYGCEHYQLSALAIQSLGFGPHSAFGVALGLGDLRPQHITIPNETKQWKAGMQWLIALAQGRNYPAEPELRNMFDQIRPPKENQPKNLLLEELYTEVARIRSKGSSWLWHIPAKNYEELASKYQL